MRYISILRGINVSSKNLIKMAALKMSFERMGFTDVITYVQSGNIIFSSKKIAIKLLEQKIREQTKKDFGFEIPTIVITKEYLEDIIAENPFTNHSEKDPSFFHVTFLASTPEAVDMKVIEAKKQEGEEIVFGKNVFYLYCPRGYGTTKLNNNFLEKKVQVTATTRNWKTTNKLWEIAMKTED